MKSTRRIHLAYIVTIVAILSVGATFSAGILAPGVFDDSVTITGTIPRLSFVNTIGDNDFEWEAFSPFLDLDNTSGESAIIRVHKDAESLQLSLDGNGNIAVNNHSTTSDNELEVFGNTTDTDTHAAVAVTPNRTAADTGSRFAVDTLGDSAAIEVRNSSDVPGSYRVPLAIDLGAPNNALTIAGDGDVGIGISKDSLEASSDLHIAGGVVTLDPSGGAGDWRITPSSTDGMKFQNQGSTPVQFTNGAPTHSLVVAADSNIGGGTATPDSPLHIFRNDGTAALKVEEASGTTAIRQMMNLQNNGGVRFSLENTANARQWEFTNDSAGNFNVSLVGTGGRELGITPAGQMIVGPGGNPSQIMQPNGNVIIQGALTQGSDRNIKENFEAVDCNEILAKVSELPVTTWNYKHDEDEVRHIGPVAQDFRAAFGLGHDDVSITTLDTDGVALASIKALNKKLEEKEATIAELRGQLDENNRRLQALEEAVLKMGE